MSGSESYLSLLQSALLQRGSQIAKFALSLANPSPRQEEYSLDSDLEDVIDKDTYICEDSSASAQAPACSGKLNAGCEVSTPAAQPNWVPNSQPSLSPSNSTPSERSQTPHSNSAALEGPSIPVPPDPNPPPSGTSRDAASPKQPSPASEPSESSPLTTPTPAKQTPPAAKEARWESACSIPEWQAEAFSALSAGGPEGSRHIGSVGRGPGKPPGKTPGISSPRRPSPTRRSTQGGSPARKIPVHSPVKQPQPALKAAARLPGEGLGAVQSGKEVCSFQAQAVEGADPRIGSSEERAVLVANREAAGTMLLSCVHCHSIALA